MERDWERVRGEKQREKRRESMLGREIEMGREREGDGESKRGREGDGDRERVREGESERVRE